MRLVLPALLGAVVLLAGCFNPDLPDAIGCADGDKCPGSMVCAEDDICRTSPGLDADPAANDGGAEQGDAQIDVGSGWSEVEANDPPPGRFGHALATNPSGGVVLFAGSLEDLAGDTWIWADGKWSEAVADEDAVPQRRLFQAMAYDPIRRVAVLFGGLEGEGGGLSDTWEWNGESWNEPVLADAGPSGRNSHAMAHDGQAIMLFGGFDAEARGDTWLWNGAAWLEKTGGPSPPPRRGHAMAYDPTRGRTVLFGGLDEDAEALDDTWEWDGSEWTEVEPTTDSPRARANHAMAFDPVHRRVVLFGGRDANNGRLGDTWVWNGQTWRDVTPDPSPGKRQGHAMARGGDRAIVLFGGRDGARSLGDTWIWNR